MEAGKLMDIQLVDHLVITKDSYLSMSEDDLI
jgi:DNA repair protein RadC